MHGLESQNVQIQAFFWRALHLLLQRFFRQKSRRPVLVVIIVVFPDGDPHVPARGDEPR